MKKTLAIILVVAMIVSIIPMSVSAYTVTGDGTVGVAVPAGTNMLQGGSPAPANMTVNAQLVVDGTPVGSSVPVTVLEGQNASAYYTPFPGTISLQANQTVMMQFSAPGYTSVITDLNYNGGNNTLEATNAFPNGRMGATSTENAITVRVVRNDNGFTIPVGAGFVVTATDFGGNPRSATTNAAGVATFDTYVQATAGPSFQTVTARSADGSLVGDERLNWNETDIAVTVGAAPAAAPTPTPGPGGLTANPSDTYAVDTWVFDGSGTITRSADYAPKSKVVIVAQADMGAQIQGLEIYDVTNGVMRYDYARGGFVNGGTSRLFTVVKSGSDKMTVTIDSIDRDYEIVATYTESFLPVVVRTNGGGTAKIIDGDNLDGKTVTIEATPFAGYEFAGWDVESVKGTAEQIVSKAGTKFSWLINYGYHGQVVFTANFVRVSGGQAAADVDGILPPNNGVASGSNNPKTGDTNVIVWALVGIVALGAVAFAAKKASAR